MSAAAKPLPNPKLEEEERRQLTWQRFKAARDRWWSRPTQANYRAYKAAERSFLEAWGTDDAL